MLIQRGKFTINSMSEIDNIKSDKDGIKKVIDLNYMGRFEFEGNAVLISRMFFEFYRDNYEFIPMNVYNKNNEQLYIYFNKEALKGQGGGFIQGLFDYLYSREYSLYNFMKNLVSLRDYLLELKKKKVNLCYTRR